MKSLKKEKAISHEVTHR